MWAGGQLFESYLTLIIFQQKSFQSVDLLRRWGGGSLSPFSQNLILTFASLNVDFLAPRHLPSPFVSVFCAVFCFRSKHKSQSNQNQKVTFHIVIFCTVQFPQIVLEDSASTEQVRYSLSCFLCFFGLFCCFLLFCFVKNLL